MKKRPVKHWNYRVVTQWIPETIGQDLYNGTQKIFPGYRVFSIAEVYYENNKPNSYAGDMRLLTDLESVKGIKWDLKKMRKALKKPILDLNNFPKKWKGKC